MVDYWQTIQSGQIWSTPVGALGLGGIGSEVNLGELALNDSSGTQVEQEAVLTLGLQRPLDVNWGGGRIYAKVLFGIGTANQTVYLDWFSGNSIELPVGKCTVTAVQTDMQGAPVMPLPAGYALRPGDTVDTRVILTASLAAGERASIAAPTLSQTFDFAAGILTVIRVPPRAKHVVIGDPRGQVASDLRVEILGSNGINRFFLVNPADSPIRTTGVVLGQADNLQILSPAGIASIPITWLLEG